MTPRRRSTRAAGPVRFYARLLLDAPRAGWDALGLVGTLVLAVAAVLVLVNRKLAEAVSSWHGFSPWWAVGPFVVFVLAGLAKANYTRFKELNARPPTIVRGGRGGRGPGGGGGGGAAVGHGDGPVIGHGGEGGRADTGTAPESGGRGGEGGQPGGPSAFDSIAQAAADLGYGYASRDFIGKAGFDPDGDEIHRVGVGGDAGQPGGPGLIIISYELEDTGSKAVEVLHADGRRCTIRQAEPAEDTLGQTS